MTIPATTPADGELLPCPFCGDTHRLITTDGHGSTLVHQCDGEGPEVRIEEESMESAVAAWNRRATPSPGKAPEPVAWMAEMPDGDREYNTINSFPGGMKGAPLYASPGKAEAERWQPIETAPKDCEVWAFNGEQGRMQWSEGSADNGEGWALWIWCDQLLSDADPEPEQPSHWMPLPAPPTSQKGLTYTLNWEEREQ